MNQLMNDDELKKKFADAEKQVADLSAIIDEVLRKLAEPSTVKPVPSEAEIQEEQKRLQKEKREWNRKKKSMHELALSMVDLGYKATSKRLHPDVGGTSEGMQELALCVPPLSSSVRRPNQVKYWRRRKL